MTSTTTTAIQDQIAELAEQGRRRIAELNEKAVQEEQRQIEARRSEIAEMWHNQMEQIRSLLPDWMHPYLSHPPDEEPTTVAMVADWDSISYYTPARLQLPGLSRIDVYVRYDIHDAVFFDVPEPEVDCIDIDDWFVRWSRIRASKHEILTMHEEIDVAVALAQDMAERLTQVEEEVRRRNEEPWSSDDPCVDPPGGGPGIGGLGLPEQD